MRGLCHSSAGNYCNKSFGNKFGYDALDTGVVAVLDTHQGFHGSMESSLASGLIFGLTQGSQHVVVHLVFSQGG